MSYVFDSSGITSPKEQRKALRRDSEFSAAVRINSETINHCRILNISANGAQLKLDETQELPDEFNLFIEDPAFEVACQIRHQCDDQYYGVMFMSNLRAALLMFGDPEEAGCQKLSN